jgi:hypothetical protein
MSRIDELMAEVFGIPENFNCTECGASTPTKEVELNAKCAPVCRACYLDDVPEEDVQGVLHDAGATDSRRAKDPTISRN